ncbi:MAG: hypothetical protein AB7H90_01515 [Alphaproteobacteria bacterium]
MPVTDLSRRRFLGAASAAVIASQLPPIPAEARVQFPALRGGTPAAAAPSGEVTTFQLVETEGAASPGFKRFGLVFADGDVPVGSRVKLQRGGADIAAQFDNRSSWQWTGGSLRTCSACIRDTDFSASESRTFSVIVESGAFDDTSALNLATALAGTDYRVEFTSMIGLTTGAFADHVSSLNTLAAVSARVEKYESGPVCDSWKVFGYASNGGVEHAHLKTIWYLSCWKDAGGSIVRREIGCVMSQDHWEISGKEKLEYVATLKDGATTIETYTGAFTSGGTRIGYVEHVYQGQWMTVRLQDDNNHATRHWRGGSQPTLLYKPDRVYWVNSKMVPPINLTKSYQPDAIWTAPFDTPSGGTIYQSYMYQPCSSQAHRTDIDGPGGYMGRGMITGTDSIAFTVPTPLNVRLMRVNAFAGLGFPYHRRSPENTLMVPIMRDERGAATPASYSDFTADGLPPARLTASRLNEGGFSPLPSSGDFPQWTVGSMRMIPSANASHAVNYSQFCYLYEGERYMLEAVLDIGINVLQQQTSLGHNPTMNWVQDGVVIYPGTPSLNWHGIGGLRSGANHRSVGFAAMLMSTLLSVPDNDKHYNFLIHYITHNARFVAEHPQYVPASDNGYWSPFGAFGVEGPVSFYESLIAQGFYLLYERTGDERWKATAERVAKTPISFAAQDRVGAVKHAYSVNRPNTGANWDATTNDYFDRYFGLSDESSGTGIHISSATNVLTLSVINMRAQGRIPFANGDRAVVSTKNRIGIAKTVPTELTLGTFYYLGDVDNAANGGAGSFRLYRDPELTDLVTFGSDYTSVWMAWDHQLANDPALQGQPVNADDYTHMARGAVVLAMRNNHPLVSQLLLDRYDEFTTPVDMTFEATFDYALP